MNKRLDPIEKRRDWLFFSQFASMRVWSSGGPIHAPHEPVLQLRIHPWYGEEESWTVYRHKAGARKEGKLVFKFWDREADLRRVRSLRGKEIPKEWRDSVSVTERQFRLPGKWVAALGRAIERISVPPITGPVRELKRVTHYKLSFWRGRQESEFSWYPGPPQAWRPLTAIFVSLLRSFRQHAKGKPLVRIDKL